ncbi:hypothetical protein BpHYR1_039070, partial [Brachionus plicatilis]
DILLLNCLTEALICYVCDSSIESNCLNGPFDAIQTSTPSINAICMATYYYNGETISQVIRSYSNTCLNFKNSSYSVHCCWFNHCNAYKQFRTISTTSNFDKLNSNDILILNAILYALFKNFNLTFA